MINPFTEESERGKRRLSRRVEMTLFALVVGAAIGYADAYKTLELVLIPSVGLIVALRGLDGYYASKAEG